jgi:murein L,D-transpeptidase YcbB/YkuD
LAVLLVASVATLCIPVELSGESGVAEPRSLGESVREALRRRIESAGYPPRIEVAGERIHASRALPRFYQRRTFTPAWIHEGRVGSSADDLLAAIRSADQEGLRSEDYHLGGIERLLQEARAPGGSATGAYVDLELLLTDGFLLFGSHLLSGRVNPETLDPEWIATRREGDLAQVLEQALEGSGVKEGLRSLLPAGPGYRRLRAALTWYREISKQGGWPTVSPGPKLELGSRDGRVQEIQRRLAAEDLLGDVAIPEPGVFDTTLHESVLEFQELRGLEPDGVVGPKTIEAMNVPAERTVEKVLLNLERWRWLPQKLGARYVLVNVADFRLFVVENADTTLTMKVVVGRDYRRTPVFSAMMTYLVLSPYWNVPPGIASKDILPKVRRDPGYLAGQKIRVYSGWGADAREVDPDAVSWAGVSAQRLPYRFRQDPGPQNALGLVKFMFPNRFSVYLHDTPAKDLFGKAERAFSSGCIRLEKPVDLALNVLEGDVRWTRERIVEVGQGGWEQTISLQNPIPVHLLYWTAWVDRDNRCHLRRDIYDRDRPLLEALREPPPFE